MSGEVIASAEAALDGPLARLPGDQLGRRLCVGPRAARQDQAGCGLQPPGIPACDQAQEPLRVKAAGRAAAGRRRPGRSGSGPSHPRMPDRPLAAAPARRSAVVHTCQANSARWRSIRRRGAAVPAACGPRQPAHFFFGRPCLPGCPSAKSCAARQQARQADPPAPRRRALSIESSLWTLHGADAVLPLQMPQVLFAGIRLSYGAAGLALCDPPLDIRVVRPIVVQVCGQALGHAQNMAVPLGRRQRSAAAPRCLSRRLHAPRPGARHINRQWLALPEEGSSASTPGRPPAGARGPSWPARRMPRGDEQARRHGAGRVRPARMPAASHLIPRRAQAALSYKACRGARGGGLAQWRFAAQPPRCLPSPQAGAADPPGHAPKAGLRIAGVITRPPHTRPVGAGRGEGPHGRAALEEMEKGDLARHMRLPGGSCIVEAARAIGDDGCFVLRSGDPLVEILCNAPRGAVRMSLHCADARSGGGDDGANPPRGGRFEVVIVPGREDGEAAELSGKTKERLARAQEGRGLRMLNLGLGVAVFAIMSATSLVALSPPLSYVFAAGALAPAGIMLARAARWLA